MKKVFTSVISILLLISTQAAISAPSKSIKHTHNKRTHSHPLPKEGVKHNHNIGAPKLNNKKSRASEEKKVIKAIDNYEALKSGKRKKDSFSKEELKYMQKVSNYYLQKKNEQIRENSKRAEFVADATILSNPATFIQRSLFGNRYIPRTRKPNRQLANNSNLKISTYKFAKNVDEIYELANGTIFKKTGHGYVGYLGYQEEIIFIKGNIVCINGQRFGYKLYEVGQKNHYSITNYSGADAYSKFEKICGG